MYAIDQSEKGDPTMPSTKNQEQQTELRTPSLKLVAGQTGIDHLPVANNRSVYEQIIKGTYTLSAHYFLGAEKPRDAERRLLHVINQALDASDTTVQYTMALLRREFDLDPEDGSVWIYFQVMENLWARLSDDTRSRHFFERRGAVTEH